MTIQEIYYLIGIVSAIVTIGLALGGVLWKIGDRILRQFDEKITSFGDVFDTKIENLKSWVGDLAQGKGAACARHEQRLDEHDRRLDGHDERITKLIEKKPRVSRKQS